MELADKILDYLKDAYRPDAVILYGSFADGSATENSDFDALVIADHPKEHDSSIIEGTVLDVFIYPPDTFRAAYDPAEFVQAADGTIVLDKTGMADSLQQRVRDYLAHLPQKSAEEIRQEVGWCEKMLSRAARGDAEGCYRWHWLLTDSLEIYSDAKGLRYEGPKRALRRMEETDAEAFRLYSRALREFRQEALQDWIAYLKSLLPSA